MRRSVIYRQARKRLRRYRKHFLVMVRTEMALFCWTYRNVQREKKPVIRMQYLFLSCNWFHSNFMSTSPNVSTLSLMLHIREVPGSIPGRESCYPELGSSWFTSVPPDKGYYLKMGPVRFLLHPFQLVIQYYVTYIVAE
jgi:hypothetical protein